MRIEKDVDVLHLDKDPTYGFAIDIRPETRRAVFTVGLGKRMLDIMLTIVS